MAVAQLGETVVWQVGWEGTFSGLHPYTWAERSAGATVAPARVGWGGVGR